MRSFTSSFCGAFTATLALLVASPASAGSIAADAPVRAEFQQAYERVFSNPLDADNDSESLRHYVLYPYLQAARIRRALELSADAQSVDKRAAEFIARYDQMPVARGVRHSWLQSLARRSQWDLFLEVYRDDGASNAARCQSFAARIALGRTDGLVDQITPQWLMPHGMPECDAAFAWLKEQGAITSALVEERARLALESNNPRLARELIRQLPPDRAAPLTQWASLLEHPERAIDAIVEVPHASVNTTALLAGWTRLAHIDPAAAKERFERLMSARHLTSAGSSPYALALALPLSRDRDPDALEYFGRVSEPDLDDGALGWRARAALWAKDWNQVSQSIAALSSTTRETARWRYWSARATEALYDPERARPMYEALLADDNYYSAMAAARLKRAVAPHPKSLQVDPALMAVVEKRPAMERARELFLCGMRPEAAAEWRDGYDELTDEQRRQAIPLAASWGWYDQAVATASSQRVFNDYVLLYPQPFDQEVKAAAHLTSLEPELIYGVLRQESLYRNDAVSNAGARGLMQLMPATARRTARDWRLPRPTAVGLFDPSVNISLGAATLRTLLDQFDDQLVVALAGYNAGPKAAARWLPQGPVDADVWIENIPYEETREYVQRVLWHSLLLRWLRNDGDAQHADSWLTMVNPVEGGEVRTRIATGAEPPRAR
jgi:soluble lytic murein transglycosylase